MVADYQRGQYQARVIDRAYRPVPQATPGTPPLYVEEVWPEFAKLESWTSETYEMVFTAPPGFLLSVMLDRLSSLYDICRNDSRSKREHIRIIGIDCDVYPVVIG